MNKTLTRVLLILVVLVLAWIIISAIVSLLVKIFMVVLVGAAILFLLNLGSRPDDA